MDAMQSRNSGGNWLIDNLGFGIWDLGFGIWNLEFDPSSALPNYILFLSLLKNQLYILATIIFHLQKNLKKIIIFTSLIILS